MQPYESERPADCFWQQQGSKRQEWNELHQKPEKSPVLNVYPDEITLLHARVASPSSKTVIKQFLNPASAINERVKNTWPRALDVNVGMMELIQYSLPNF